MIELTFKGNIRRLRVRPGDWIVLETDKPLSPDQAFEALKQIEKAFPDNPSMMLLNGTRVAAVLRPEEAEQNLSDLPDPSNRSTGV